MSFNRDAAFMKKLFGTDGVRAEAGKFPLDEQTVRAIGYSLGKRFEDSLGRPAKFVIGRDTRESGDWIERALSQGLSSSGASFETAGVITTPGVAYLTAAFKLDAGIVISASHNPFEDNGIKVFMSSGRKLDAKTERLIEQDVFTKSAIPEVEVGLDIHCRKLEFQNTYRRHLQEDFADVDLKGLKIALDCANGAASEYAPELFSGFGASVTAINCSPNGRNINKDCGSLHLEVLQNSVRETGADFGVAFDGDADRSLFVDEQGEVVDGDATLWILANYFLEQGKLANKAVVATVMSNIGLEIALSGIGVKLDRTDVGDKYVLEELIRSGSEIGGEQSGHLIFPERSLVGDGMVTALLVLRALISSGKKFSELREGFTRYPQVLVNVKVGEKRPFDEVPQIADAADRVRAALDGNGRLLLRYSGTENLARVMIEGKDQTEIERTANELASVIHSALS